jgi:PAS domain S-box-containing protein
MKIKKRLNLNTVFSVAAVVLILLSLAWSYREDSKANQNMDLVAEIRNVAFERVMLRDDYLLHGEERAKIQWHAKTETLRRLLDIADQRITGRPDRDLLRKARMDFDATRVSISSLMERHKGKDPGSAGAFNLTETESMLISQAFLKAYSLTDSINRLHVSADHELARVRERSIVIVVFFLFAGIIVIIVNSVVLNRLLNRRILELGNGIEIIGAGDLDYRIDAQGDDELSALARGANEMAGKLKMSHTSLENLQKEIAERKRAVETIRQSERKLSLHLQQTMFAVIEWDPEFRVREWNPAATAIFGYSREEAMGRHVAELIIPRSITEEIGKVVSHLLAQSGGTYNTNENVTKDGRVIVCDWYNTPLIDERGTATGAISFALDITDRKQAADEIARYSERLKRSNEELQRFAYVASHDLQEPLRTIASFLQLIEKRNRDLLDAESKEFISFAVSGASRLQIMINNLLEYSRLESRGNPFVRVESGDILRKVIDDFGPEVERSNAIITLDDLPALMADPGQLGRLFQNLVGNALKFQGEEPPRIHVAVRREERNWVFSVHDDGIGIDPKYKDRIFVIFQRLHTMETYAGTGIGLSICKKIVERHGGRIWVESEPGKGSTFYFTIPAKEADSYGQV